MSTPAILINPISQEEFYNEFSKLAEALKKLQEKLEDIKSPNEYLSREDTANLLKCDLSTIHNMTKRGDLISYGMRQSSRVYYKRRDIEEALIQINSKKK